MDTSIRLMKVERVDDMPVLLAQLNTMHVAALLDEWFPTHGHWTGEVSFGEVVAVWLTCILSEGDHCLSHVQPWVAEHLETLSACMGKRVRPLDVHDDRLADVLEALSEVSIWNDDEAALNGHLVRVYEWEGDRVRIDSTSAKTYAGVSPDGLLQFGHSKDHRPDLPQVKVNVSALDPLGLPLTTTVVGGQCADDPLYVPEIKRVQHSLGAGGKTYIGDCKMGALATRASVAASQDYYLCPLAGPQLPDADLNALLEAGLHGAHTLEAVYAPDTVGSAQPVRLAEGSQAPRALIADLNGQPVRWTERRLVVCSVAHAARQAESLTTRLRQAVTDIDRLNERKQGKKRLSADQLHLAAAQFLQRRAVEGLVRVHVRTTARDITKRKYGSRLAQVVRDSQSTVHAQVDEAAVTAAKQRLGWRVYATNHPSLTLPAVVLAYRQQYVIEREFGRLKGKALSLTPLYLHTDARITGLLHLLTIALRVLTLLEFVVRRHREQAGNPVQGLYAGNPQRATARPTAESILRAFHGITLVVQEVNGHVTRMLSPLGPLQQHVLRLLRVAVDTYLRLVNHFLEPVPI